MMSKIKQLSFNARLVITMNCVMIFVMLAVGVVASYKTNQSLENEFSDKIDLQVSFLKQVLEKDADNSQKAIAAFDKFAQENLNLSYFEVKSGEELVASQGKHIDGNLKLARSTANGFEIVVSYNFSSLKAQKTSAILELFFWLCAAMLMFSVSLFVVSKFFISPLYEVVDTLSNSSKQTTIHSLKLKEMSASVQSSGDIINAGTESTTESMGHLSSTVEESVGELNKCEGLASGVNTKADQGAGVMNRLVSSMQVIEEANQKLNELGSIFEEISSKTSVINDIVFKTQLLSFNASIEAARAGQHGRGFSVVAEEIGNLAQMSGKSATEISTLLSSSEEHVKKIISGTDEKIAEGRSVSMEALQSFEEIRKDIGQISSSISSVTESSQGQESSIKQTLDTMLNLRDTVGEQGIYTRSIGKSAEAIGKESSALEKAERRAKSLIYGRGGVKPNKLGDIFKLPTKTKAKKKKAA